MIKRSSKVHFIFEGKKQNVKQIFEKQRKQERHSKYICSAVVQVVRDSVSVEARIVCVHNRNNRKEWVALISTDMSLSEEDIIRIYGKRWDIEVFFKVCKSYLQLTTGYHGLSYDALTAHVAIVFTRYMLLTVEERSNKDNRTLGELFYVMVEEMADLNYSKSLNIILLAVFNAVKGVFKASNEQLYSALEQFLNNLPGCLKQAHVPIMAPKNYFL